MWAALASVAGSALSGGDPGGGPNVSGSPVYFQPSYSFGRSSLKDPATLALLIGVGILALYAARKFK